MFTAKRWTLPKPYTALKLESSSQCLAVALALPVKPSVCLPLLSGLIVRLICH